MAPDGFVVEETLRHKTEIGSSAAYRAQPGLAIGGATKRLFDIVGSACLIVALLPLFLLIAVFIKLNYPGPIFFQQKRIGFAGRRFGCLKFRSMVVNSQEILVDLLARDEHARREWEDAQKLRNDPRITPFGRLLRESSLDELPQLFNVLRGEMSLVGPRPIVDEEATRYGPYFTDYVSTRPGMTGLWQVSGRSSVDYAKRISLDVSYVRNWSLLSDVVIMLRTVREVLASKDSC